MRNLFIITTLALVLVSAQAQIVTDPTMLDLTTLPMLHTAKNPTDFAELLCFIWRIIELICVLLLLIDVIMRMSGKALYFIHACRYIIFTFGASACIYGGSKFLFAGTRWYMSVHLYKFLEHMYMEYLGWDLPTNTDIFNPPADGLIMFTNVTFWEQVILLVLILTWGIMKVVLKKAAMMSKAYHLVKSLFLVFFISFMFPLIYFGGLFWRQHFEIGLISPAVKRNYLGYWFNWLMVFFWFGVALFLLYSMVKTALDPIDGDQTVQANYEQPDFVHERNELTNAESKY